MIYYGVTQILDYITKYDIDSFTRLLEALPATPVRLKWTNVGGQLLPVNSLTTLLQSIKNASINSWDEVHDFYEQNGKLYQEQKLQHAYSSLLEVLQLTSEQLTKSLFKKLLYQTLDIKEWVVKNIYESRAKDFQNKFRKMVYDNEAEMEMVLGRLDDNVFIAQQKEDFIKFRSMVEDIITHFNL